MVSPADLRLVFGLVASTPEGDASASFDALAAWMRAESGVHLERKALPSYRALAESVRAGESDLAWLPPVVYAWLAEGVTPFGCIVRGGSTQYAATLVALAGSERHALADLAGTRAGWVDPWSAAGYVVPRIELARAGIDPAATFAKETFYGSHQEVLRALARGECDVAGTYEGAWSEQADLSVRVIATFGSIPSDVIAARRNLGPTEYERAFAALRTACSDRAGRTLVRAVFNGDELREGIDPGHEALRSALATGTANGLFD